MALSRSAREWALIAILGIGAPVLVAHACAPQLLAKPAWSAIEALTALAAALLAWRHRDRANMGDTGLVGGTALAALLAGVAGANLVGPAWSTLPASAAMLALGAWAWRARDRQLAVLPALALLAALLLGGQSWAALLALLGASLTGEHLTYSYLPPLADTLRHFAVPALAAAALLVADRASFGSRPAAGTDRRHAARHRDALRARQGAARDRDPGGFSAFGSPSAPRSRSRCSAPAGLAWRRPATARIADWLAALALFRLAWFDCIVLNPVVVMQQVGPIPVPTWRCCCRRSSRRCSSPAPAAGAPPRWSRARSRSPPQCARPRTARC